MMLALARQVHLEAQPIRRHFKNLLMRVFAITASTQQLFAPLVALHYLQVEIITLFTMVSSRSWLPASQVMMAFGQGKRPALQRYLRVISIVRQHSVNGTIHQTMNSVPQALLTAGQPVKVSIIGMGSRVESQVSGIRRFSKTRRLLSHRTIIRTGISPKQLPIMQLHG